MYLTQVQDFKARNHLSNRSDVPGGRTCAEMATPRNPRMRVSYDFFDTLGVSPIFGPVLRVKKTGPTGGMLFC